MRLQFDSRVCIPLPTSLQWSMTQVDAVDQGFLVFFVVCTGTQDPAVCGKQIVESWKTSVVANPTVESFVSFFQTQSLFSPEIQIASAFLGDNESLFASFGDSACELVRDRKRQTILATQKEESPVPSLMRGEVHGGDTVFLGTHSFFSQIADQIAEASDPLETTQKCALELTETADMPLVAGCTVVISEGASEAIVQEEDPVPVIRPALVQKMEVPVGTNISLQSRKKKNISLQLFQLLVRFRIIFFALFCVLIAGIGFFIVQRVVLNRRQDRITEAISPYENRLADSLQIPEDQKVEQIKQLRSLLQDLTQYKDQSSVDRALIREIDILLEKVKKEYTARSLEKSVEKLSVFFDFRLVFADFIGNAVGFDDPGKLAVFLDSTHKRLLSLSLENKQPQTLSLSDGVGDPLSLAVDSRKAYVLGTKGIAQNPLPLDQQGKIIISGEQIWEQPSLVSTFASNVYVLDTKKRELLRFDTSDPSASSSAWFKSKEDLEFEKISSLSVDGDVWMGTTDGEILRFSKGVRSDFTVSGLVDEPTSTLFLYTSTQSEKLYVIEPRAKRMMILSKSGAYESSFVSEDLALATGIIVDESTQKAYVLAGSLVYQVELE